MFFLIEIQYIENIFYSKTIFFPEKKYLFLKKNKTYKNRKIFITFLVFWNLIFWNFFWGNLGIENWELRINFHCACQVFSPDSSSFEAVSKTHISGLATKARRHKVLKLNWLNTAPVRCFHLTAPVLSGEKHLTSAVVWNADNANTT